ncbi:I78 family peptidase inhibitor [Luteimonas salinilitoris]|uniref:I78 family peptidase inhibitor n=1 Tax=Luteimonas salinilitoris TaxID=3237697 RepID=A0ABV4HMD6_9GAMM
MNELKARRRHGSGPLISLVRTLALCAGTLCSIAGCATAPENTDTDTREDQCRADLSQWAVGQVINDAIVNRIQVESRASQVRRLRPGQPMTRDFRRDRVNVEIDNAGRIQAVACG